MLLPKFQPETLCIISLF